MQSIAEKMDVAMTRIQGVEMDTERIFNELVEFDEGEAMSKFKELIFARMQRVEKDASTEIQDIIEPSVDFIKKKRKLREVDNFLDAFLDFLNNQ